ncbi:MAG: hypothetical protein ACXABO_07965 [Promethearchaeota archaeon]|jgi:hypothetical protein
MKKSLVRAFLFSLLIFLVLNFLIYIVAYAIADLLNAVFDPIANHPTHSIYLMIYPSRYFPWELIGNSIDATLAFKILYLGGVVSFVIAAIVAGLMGGSVGKSFGGWILTAICYMLLFITIISIDEFNLNYISFTATLVDGIVIVLIAGTVNALIFGGLVFIIALIKGRS